MTETANLDADLQAAVARVNTLPNAPGPQDLLALYGYYKQATQGDATGARPGMLDIKGRAKFDAWAAHKGLGKEAAVKGYIATVERLFSGK